MKTIDLSALYHVNYAEYRRALPDGRVSVRLRARRGDLASVTLLHRPRYGEAGHFLDSAQEAPMTLYASDELCDVFQCVFTPKDWRVCYLFKLPMGDGSYLYMDQDGVKTESELRLPENVNPYPFACAYPAQPMPGWASGCVGYQIFPDRFRRGQGADERGLCAWDSTDYANDKRFGGNLRGMLEAVPYLSDLGVRMVYMTPIFLSNTSHRYNTFDYFKIDPLLGTEDDLRAFADALHARGMRLVLDGVFNHSGDRFRPFRDALRHRQGSRYYDWFFFDETCACGYQTFAHEPYMPKLNLSSERAREYFIRVGLYWLERAGIDGWRLDVSPEIDAGFVRAFRSAVKKKNPEALIIAECWDDAREWLCQGDLFDSTMNYVFSRAMWRFFADRSISLRAFDQAFGHMRALYPDDVHNVNWNLLDSHDTARFITRAGDRPEAMRAAVFFQMTVPGIPVVYYGGELGMRGGPDPDCRRPMRWDDVEGNETLAFYKRLIALRASVPALRSGAFATLRASDATGLYAYARVAEREKSCVLCALSTGGAFAGNVPLPEPLRGAKSLRNLLTDQPLAPRGNAVRLNLAPGEGVVIGL